MRTRSGLLLFTTFLTFASLAWGQPPTPPSASNEQHEADVALYRHHLETLANPFMEGRGPGTRGNRIAAEYFEFYFDRMGLRPVFRGETKAADGSVSTTPGASFRQPFN